jgi:hypothetical protein
MPHLSDVPPAAIAMEIGLSTPPKDDATVLAQVLLNGTPTRTKVWRSSITPTADEKRHWTAAEVAYATSPLYPR